MTLLTKNTYRWVYFLDDSYEEWLLEMPAGGVLVMPHTADDNEAFPSRNFLTTIAVADQTESDGWNCTVNEVPIVLLD